VSSRAGGRVSRGIEGKESRRQVEQQAAEQEVGEQQADGAAGRGSSRQMEQQAGEAARAVFVQAKAVWAVCRS
jgi:hypothetical protein